MKPSTTRPRRRGRGRHMRYLGHLENPVNPAGDRLRDMTLPWASPAPAPPVAARSRAQGANHANDRMSRGLTAMLPSERIPYSAIKDRPRLVLPDGGRLIVWVIVNVEEWNPRETMPRTVLTPPAGGSPNPDIPNWAWHEYGNRVGFWRMLDVLDRFEFAPRWRSTALRLTRTSRSRARRTKANGNSLAMASGRRTCRRSPMNASIL